MGTDRSRKSILPRHPFVFRSFGALLVFVLFAVAEETNVLYSVSSVKTPVIHEKKISYSVNFVFKECPDENWWYYDSSNKQVVVEFYDNEVVVADSLRAKGVLRANGIEIKNIKTSIVPSGKKSQVILNVKVPMYCRTSCQGDTLKVVLWKDLKPAGPGQKKWYRSVWMIPVVTFAVSLIAAFIFISSTSETAR